jgi:hypothetical protein
VADATVANLIGRETLERLFEPQSQLNHVGTVFARLGLAGEEEDRSENSMTSAPSRTRHIP